MIIFIELQLTYSEEYMSRSAHLDYFNMCICLHNHHPGQDREHFQQPRRFPHALS